MKQSDWYGITGILCLSQMGQIGASGAALLAFVIAMCAIFQEQKK